LQEGAGVVIGERIVLSLAFVIELGSDTVGLVVRDGKRYWFHAAGREFSALEGRSFRSPQEAEKAIRKQESRRSKDR
jgi:hypothetical protein